MWGGQEGTWGAPPPPYIPAAQSPMPVRMLTALESQLLGELAQERGRQGQADGCCEQHCDGCNAPIEHLSQRSRINLSRLAYVAAVLVFAMCTIADVLMARGRLLWQTKFETESAAASRLELLTGCIKHGAVPSYLLAAPILYLLAGAVALILTTLLLIRAGGCGLCFSPMTCRGGCASRDRVFMSVALMGAVPALVAAGLGLDFWLMYVPFRDIVSCRSCRTTIFAAECEDKMLLDLAQPWQLAHHYYRGLGVVVGLILSAALILTGWHTALVASAIKQARERLGLPAAKENEGARVSVSASLVHSPLSNASQPQANSMFGPAQNPWQPAALHVQAPQPAALQSVWGGAGAGNVSPAHGEGSARSRSFFQEPLRPGRPPRKQSPSTPFFQEPVKRPKTPTPSNPLASFSLSSPRPPTLQYPSLGVDPAIGGSALGSAAHPIHNLYASVHPPSALPQRPQQRAPAAASLASFAPVPANYSLSPRQHGGLLAPRAGMPWTSPAANYAAFASPAALRVPFQGGSAQAMGSLLRPPPAPPPRKSEQKEAKDHGAGGVSTPYKYGIDGDGGGVFV